MAFLRAYRLCMPEGDLIIEECDQPDQVAIVLERGGDLRRLWLTADQWRDLCALSYTVVIKPAEEA